MTLFLLYLRIVLDTSRVQKHLARDFYVWGY